MKGNKSRMGKGKAPIASFFAKLYKKDPLFFWTEFHYSEQKNYEGNLN